MQPPLISDIFELVDELADIVVFAEGVGSWDAAPENGRRNEAECPRGAVSPKLYIASVGSELFVELFMMLC